MTGFDVLMIAFFPSIGLAVCFGRQIGEWMDRKFS